MKEPIFIKEFLPKQVLNFIHNYSIISSNMYNYQQEGLDNQSNSFVGKYSDLVMETLLDMSTPVVEQNIGKKLWPTYSYFRIYDKGSDLKIHKDRPSCEYTVALCIGADPVDRPYEIFVGEKDETSDYKYFNRENDYGGYKINYKFPMVPNNALIFKGMENVHWREYCKHDYFMTVFLHYVDQEGEYKDCIYDKRICLGETTK